MQPTLGPQTQGISLASFSTNRFAKVWLAFLRVLLHFTTLLSHQELKEAQGLPGCMPSSVARFIACTSVLNLPSFILAHLDARLPQCGYAL